MQVKVAFFDVCPEGSNAFEVSTIALEAGAGSEVLVLVTTCFLNKWR